MKSELERYKEAMEYAIRLLETCSRNMVSIHFEEALKVDIKTLHEKINPPPIMEDVEEIVGWVNVYQSEDGSLFTGNVIKSEEVADRFGKAALNCTRISCQPIKVTVQREKKAPVEQSCTLELHDDGSWLGHGSKLSRAQFPVKGLFTWPE